MEFLFSGLKKMDVVSLNDGKNLGKVCDIAFFFPENRLKGLFVTGARGFRFSKSDVFIPMSEVVRVGEDVILVRQGNADNVPPDCPPRPQPPKPCPPKQPCPPKPPCPPSSQLSPPNPPRPQPPRPPQYQPNPPQYPQPPYYGRRNYDDYE